MLLEAHRGSGGIEPLILSLGSRWRVASIKVHPRYTWETPGNGRLVLDMCGKYVPRSASNQKPSRP
jgi:hypothetical protein